MNKQARLGAILVLLGLFFGLVQLRWLNSLLVLPAISSALLALYLVFGGRQHDGNLGFLIPGCILAAISIFVLGTEYGLIAEESGHLLLFLMGAAFLVVLLVHTRFDPEPDFGSRYWPIFPACGLFFPGVFVMYGMQTTRWLWSGLLLPLGLLTAGVILWLRGRNANRL